MRTDYGDDPSNYVGSSCYPYYAHDKSKGVPGFQSVPSAIGNGDEQDEIYWPSNQPPNSFAYRTRPICHIYDIV